MHARRELEWLENRLPTTEARFAIPFIFRGRGRFRSIRARQTVAELQELYRRVVEAKPCRVVEIGTARGGTLYLWAQAAADNATIVSVDLPGGPFGGGYEPCRKQLYMDFKKSDAQQMHLIRDDSHLHETFERVRKTLDGQQADLLFIDADHTYEGVKTDFIQYAPLVRPGGMIAMHDIKPSSDPDTQVERLWVQLKERIDVDEIVFPDVANKNRELGIGVITVPAGGIVDQQFD